MFVHLISLLENRDGHLAGLIEAKPEELGKICPNRKDDFTLYNFVFKQIFCRCMLRRYDFLKNNVCSLFFLSTKIVTATLRALWRLNQKS